MLLTCDMDGFLLISETTVSCHTKNSFKNKKTRIFFLKPSIMVFLSHSTFLVSNEKRNFVFVTVNNKKGKNNIKHKYLKKKLGLHDMRKSCNLRC